MAQKLLIIGESGSGKSCSIRNCNPETTAIISPEKESLPFGKKAQKYPGKYEMLCNVTDSHKICKFMKDQAAAGKKLIIVDDFQYILAIPYMNRIKETGWDKYNDFGANYFEIIEVCKDLPDDVVVAYMSHGETLDNGLFTVKLIGKLLREKITIEGLFTVVLRTGVSEAKYYFYTQTSGKDTTKSPMGMFPAYAIDNDLEYVADKIRNYYEVGEYKPDEEMKQADQAVAADVEKPDANGRRSRSGRKATQQGEADAPDASTQRAAKNALSADDTGAKTKRKSRAEVQEENKQKVDDYMNKCDEAVAAVAGDREEIPFDEAAAATDSVPKPDLQKPPRRTRKERKANDGTTNTDSESVTLKEDTYFYIPANDNYVMKHKGDTVDLIVNGEAVAKVITKEEFGKGLKRIAQAEKGKTDQTDDVPADAEPTAMNPPETPVRGQRRRRTR